MTKSKYIKLQEKLCPVRKSAWLDHLNVKNKSKLFSFCEKYKEFLDKSKTERETTFELIKLAKAKGFKEFSSFKQLKEGDKFFYNNKKKSLVLGIIGEKLEFNMVGSHVDSPRIDLKPRPFYEDNDLALLKTHYYGGLKKYQWFNTPLSIHGTIIDKHGNTKTINIGEKEEDPIFVISDLLPHLERKKESQPVKEAFQAETMNLIVGNIPITKDEKIKDSVKLNVLNIIYQKYGLTEEDFISAEIELVPSFKARDLGFDRGLIVGYGHDDRSCAYASAKALFLSKDNKKTKLAFFYDKEEIGSMGNTGAASLLMPRLIEQIIRKTGRDENANEIMSNSTVISADVAAGFNPSFPDVHDPRNAPFLGKGVALEKHTGYGGKYGGNDANAEYFAEIIRIMNKKKISWQVSELGKVDVGGGGTIALFISKYGCEVFDAGVPVLGMHSPYEIISKVDLYSAFKAYKVFLEH